MTSRALRRGVLSAALTLVIAPVTARSADPVPSTPATTAVTTPTTPASTPATSPLTTPVTTPPSSPATPPAPPGQVGTTDEAWSLPDALVQKIDGGWQKNRALYVDRNSVSIRANAMLLELHSLAALAGHTGPARQDARIPGLVRFFTTPPVVVYKTRTKRGTASFPHTPAWESVYRGDSERAILHPSADSIVARALATAWRARDVAGLPLEDAQRIQSVVGAVARGKWYKAPTRAENQINWNTDIYQANLEVNGDRGQLADYRAHLKWFVDHFHKTAYKGGSTNLSRGDGFRYLPQHDGGGANSVDTVEYANLVHSSLGFYTEAVRAGMRPLSGRQIASLKAWSRHILFGTWTQAGYLNWDSGLGSARRHIRQYWGFALDSLVRSSGPGAMLGTANQRAYVKSIALHGLEMFRRTAWDGTGPLPSATSFDAPNGFPAGTKSALITTLRFAIIAAALDVRLPATSPRPMGNVYSHDSEFGRLAISTSSYNLGIVKPVVQGEGGLEPTRLYDGLQRPLTVLGAGGFGGPAPGVRLARGGAVILDDQPGTQTRGAVPGMSVSGARRNRAGTFAKVLAAGATIRSGKATGQASISVQHRFDRTSISTKYRIRRGKATTATVRLPVWGSTSQIELMRGATQKGNRIRRSGSGTILMRGTTKDGAIMLVAFRGIPRRATIVIVHHGRSARAPQGARELRIRFAVKNGMALSRRIAVVAATAK